MFGFPSYSKAQLLFHYIFFHLTINFDSPPSFCIKDSLSWFIMIVTPRINSVEEWGCNVLLAMKKNNRIFWPYKLENEIAAS